MKSKIGAIPMPTFCKKAVDHEFIISGGYSAEFYGWTTKTANIGTAIRQVPYTFLILMLEDKIQNQVTTCSDFPSEAMLWIKEVEMVDSLDELKSSRSVYGKDFPNFEMLDAKIASPLNTIIQKFPVQEEGQPRGAESPKGGSVLLRGRKTAFMIYDYFRVTGAHDTVLDYDDLLSVTLRDDNVQEFDTRWDEVNE